jgi:soluble lytic murein transglycosylase-like protein
MRSLALFVALILGAPAARAEIAVLANGQTMKVTGHRVEGDTVFLALKGGGEVGTPVDQVRGFVPDEVADEVAAPQAGTREELEALAADVARRHGLDPALVLAVASVESAFAPQAVSPKGAQGIMQLMPATASDLGVKNAFDPEANLDGGSRYLAELIALYKGDLPKALAAYNAGPGAVKRHRGIPPYRETRAYVRKVLKRYQDAAKDP